MTDTQPKRVLGFWACLALVVGNMIGTGIYLLPASLAPYGWNAIIGWIVTIAGGLCLAFVFAKLANRVPESGGPYAYTRAAFGPLASYVVAWTYWVVWWTGNAAIAIAFVSYLSFLFPALATVPGAAPLTALAAVWGLTAVNCRGVAEAGRVQAVTTVLKVLPLIAVVILAAILFGQHAPVKTFEPGTINIGAIGATASITLWALLAFESATVPAEGVRDPSRTIPRATMIGMALVGVIYLLVSTAITLLMPADQAAASAAPIADFIATHWGHQAGMAVAGFAAISAFGTLNGCILIQGEVLWAMAAGGVFPAAFAKHSRRGTPVRAHILSSVLLTVVMLSNYTRTMSGLFTFTALLSTAAALVAYLVCALAALKLMGRQPPVAILGVLAVLYSLWATVGTGIEAIGWALALILAGLPIYWWVRRSARVTSSAATAP